MKNISNLSKSIRLLLFCCFALSSMAMREELPWKAGTAKMIITPEKQVWLAGYGYKREPEEILHDLWVKALVLEDRNGMRSVVVTSDLMGIPRYMYESISRKLMERFHLERSQILLTFSHNHCGPRLHEDLVDYYPKDSVQNELVREYSDKLEEKIIETVAHSFADLSPARLMMGEGTASFAVNRRNNVESDVPELLSAGRPLAGPVDHSVPVLAIYKEGDQNPLPRREVLLCEDYGNRLSDEVVKALQGPLKTLPSELSTAFEFVDLDYLNHPTREELEGAISEQDKDSSARVRIRASWAGRMLEKMDRGEPFASYYPYPVQVWKLGGILHWISLGGEAVVDYSLRFKKELGPNTWVCGYANVLVAYIPSLRVYNEGGYEGGAFLYEYGLPANRWAGDVEERITDAVQRLVRKVQ